MIQWAHEHQPLVFKSLDGWFKHWCTLPISFPNNYFMSWIDKTSFPAGWNRAYNSFTIEYSTLVIGDVRPSSTEDIFSANIDVLVCYIGK